MAGAGVFPKTATVDIIYQLDYNSIQSTIAGVLNTFYGQPLSSSQVSSNPLINDVEWDQLRADIDRCYKHITGANSGISNVTEGGLVLAADANAYKTAADYCENNKTSVHPSQLTSSVISTSRTTTWNGTFRLYNRYTWGTADEATQWFNLGGRFVVDVSGDGADPGSPKDLDWQDGILNAIPTQTYNRTNWINGTNIDVYEYGNNAKYTENYCRIFCQKVSDTRLDIYVIISESDVGDQTGIGPAVDESVNTNVYASVTTFSSFDAIVASGLIETPVENFDGIVGAFNLNLSSNNGNIPIRGVALGAGWNGSDYVVATVVPGAYITSNDTSQPAITIEGSFPNGVKLINNGFVIGMGGKGGDTVQPGLPGGPAVSTSVPVTIENNGTLAGGGGGGGAGVFWAWNGLNRSTPGSGGASGGFPALGGGGGPNTQGAQSIDSNGDGIFETPGPSQNWGWGGRASSPGGKGGNWGQAGDAGGTVDGAYDQSGYAGGAAGSYIVGNSLVTWTANGTRLGNVS